MGAWEAQLVMYCLVGPLLAAFRPHIESPFQLHLWLLLRAWPIFNQDLLESILESTSHGRE